MLIVRRLEKMAGKLCEALLQINHEYYLGSGKAVEVCTLSRNGVDSAGRIIGAVCSNPIVTSSMLDMKIFRHQVQMIDLIGIADIGKIA